ncbi:arylamine N-acetyltransferase family protein [Aspergillus homomorphus CBS 101889]|uniref:N-hydroxyarylamine O-acetyltransferase n=1 Tax=Aspergillus homomorphus (strain CBS 101889) TaxID=1450537 RepID=A0A395HIS6_ASPHC|nr:N-hydroxyarylamine O-acetyltransferase [Aspergillus homomorphus CBS 101889]RAL07832.1 N-hydroxyarylamine O-acetyltransferase [Aspergillus homomorphus CBS 101889]
MGSHMDWSQRPIYSPDQVERYYDRIGLPRKYRRSSIPTDEEAALGFLRVLLCYQVAAVPFENLNLHYSVHRDISVDPFKIFEKVVDSKAARGGYCMENSSLFGTVLRSLGYQVYPVGGRVNEAAQPMSASKNWKGPKFDGWNHLVNIVTIGTQEYLVDVGFGSNGPHQPVPLTEGYQFHNVGDQRGRLVHGPIAQYTRAGQSIWQYEFSNGEAPWIPAYCFTEEEFLPEDFAMINYYMSTHRASWFTFHVVCVRMILDEAGERLVGDLTLFNDKLKRRIGATSELVASFTSEEERVAALETYFQIPLTAADRESIRHTITEIL